MTWFKREHVRVMIMMEATSIPTDVIHEETLKRSSPTYITTNTSRSCLLVQKEQALVTM